MTSSAHLFGPLPTRSPRTILRRGFSCHGNSLTMTSATQDCRKCLEYETSMEEI
jgi:hypothetical protein